MTGPPTPKWWIWYLLDPPKNFLKKKVRPRRPGKKAEELKCSHLHTCYVPAIVGNEKELVEVCLDCGQVKVDLVTFEWEADDFTPPLLPQARARMAGASG